MRIKIGDTTLFFDVDGEGLTTDGPEMRKKPTMLLLHGGPGMDHSSFKPFFSQFTDVAQIVYLDQRGMGRSDRGDRSKWLLDQWAQDVKDFCDALEIDSPVVLGHSFGGFVATRYAAMFPDQPSKLIISSSPARFDHDVATGWYRELGGEQAVNLYRRVFVDLDMSLMPDFLKEVYPLYNSTPQDPDASKRIILNLEMASHFFTGEAVGFDQRSQVQQIVCPTLVLAGERDPMTPRATADEFAGLLTNNISRYEIVENAGHGVWKDQPEQTTAILREFLAAD